MVKTIVNSLVKILKDKIWEKYNNSISKHKSSDQ